MVMDMKNPLIEKFRKFIGSISKDDIVAVLHHTDPDGVCSGVIMAKLVEKKRGKKIDFRFNQRPFEIPIIDATVEILRQNKVNKLITTDLCVDQAPENVKKIGEFAEILVLDHHKVYQDLNSEKVIFIKPQLVSDKKPASYPASKFCFDLASEIEDMKDLDWVAAIGVIGDSAFSAWKDFLGEVFAKYNIEKKKDVFETGLGKAASLISNAESYDSKNSAESFDILYKAGSPNDILTSSLQKYRDEVDSEIKYWMGHFDDFAEKKQDFVFYIIKSKFDIKSPISTRLGLKNPDKTIFVLQEGDNGEVWISARRIDEKIAMNNTIEEAISGLEGARGGGHIPAAGATIRKEDIQKFKEKLMKILGIE